ncbi:unnamed protein product [Scytosiphon promiscuus]
MLLPLALCGHLTPMANARPMLASCRARLLYHSRLNAVRRLGSSAGTGAETSESPLSLLIFHRHGDRSPLRGHTPDEELATQSGKATDNGVGGVPPAAKTAEDYWRKQLVSPEEVRRLDKLYPVKCSPGEAVPPDEESAPFGCLTSLGLKQLRERGRVFRQGYSVDGIDAARVEVFSTNYRRTQLSAQGFLDGFLGDAEGGRGGGVVPVVVRPKADDFLNQWESQGHVMYERMMMVESGPAFQETEESVGGPLKRKLHELDPALFPLPRGGRFRWMMAADYFMSARARGLRVAPELDALGTATIRHLIWRFSRFYGDEEMMKTMAGPLLAYIIECAKTGNISAVTGKRDSRTVPGTVPGTEGVGGSSSTLSRVVSSSCHDVTVLALLGRGRGSLGGGEKRTGRRAVFCWIFRSMGSPSDHASFRGKGMAAPSLFLIFEQL